MRTSTRLRLSSPFLQTVMKSGLLSADDLIGALAMCDADQVAEAQPIQIATFLVRKKLLTKFQALQLLNGKTQGFLLGRYRIQDGLRQDRVGLVFLAEECESKHPVAVKVLPTDRVTDPLIYQPFLEEVRHAAQVIHSSVAQVLDLGVWCGTHYVVTEYISSPTLDKIVATYGPFPTAAAVRVIAQVAIGLAHAHKVGLLHRDVKPANIALQPDRRVKLLDLGLTRMVDNPWANTTKRINLEEYAEEIAHVAPEQGWGRDLDARSDIYSLGSTAYYLLTGKNPFPGSALTAMQERRQRDIPKPSDVNPEVPAELDELVCRMGAKDPDERFQTAEELIASLQPWLPLADRFALGIRVNPRVEQPLQPVAPPERNRGLLSGVTSAIGRLFRR